MTKNSRKRHSTLDVLRQELAAVAPERDLAAYEDHAKQYFEGSQPAGPVEIHLVKVIAHIAWWLRRIPAVETNILNEAIAKRQESVPAGQPPISSGLAMAMAFCDQGKVLNKLSLHHERLSIVFCKFVKQLHKIQADRRACEPRQDGFVLSGGKIETRVHRNDRLRQAWNARPYRA
jgi:hypothetical protein